MNTETNTRRILHATQPAIMTIDEIKGYIAKTTVKTAEFIAAVLHDASEGEDYIELADGKKAKFKSIKSPKQLIEFWCKHKLPVGALTRHVKKVWQAAPQKLPKVQIVKPRKPKAEKPAKAPKTTTGKRGRPRKAATVLMIEDFRQGDLNLEVIAA